MTTKTALSAAPKEQTLKTGIVRNDRKKVAKLLSESLASTYILYLKTQNCHWNVVGPSFFGIHQLTEKHYLALASAIDLLAERIRAIGFPAPGSFAAFLKMTDIKEAADGASVAQMIGDLADDNERCAAKMREAVEAADEVNDVATADLLTRRIGEHEENAWMLRAIGAE